MNSLPLAVLVICFTTINCQWVIHNQTVINTTVIQNPGYGPVYHQPRPQPPPYGFRPNVTQPRFDPYGGYVNQSAVGRRNGNDLIVGSPGPNDVIVFKQWFVKAARWLQIREKTVTYPVNAWASRYQYTITAVSIFDLAKGPGGHASIMSGGPGHRNVTVRLFSDRGYGFNFKVVIHGR